jgi:hypothetical protein
MPIPVELLDEADDELAPEPEGVPKPEDDDNEDEDEDGDRVPAPNGVPNPDDAAEAGAALGGVNPPGRFGDRRGWPPALALDAMGGMPLVLSEACKPTAEPAGCPG